MRICLHIVYGWFHIATAEMSSTTETVRPAKPEIFITWLLAENVCNHWPGVTNPTYKLRNTHLKARSES